MNYYTAGVNFVFALNLMLPEGDRKDRPYLFSSVRLMPCRNG